MSHDEEYVFAWLDALDRLSYYELFGVPSRASADEIQSAFHDFCDTFHPDMHVARNDAERRALLVIFKRGTEAYSVLGDGAYRAQYDAQLAARPSTRPPPRLSFSPVSRPPSRAPAATVTLEEHVRSPSARPFARQAEELLSRGDWQHAKLQLVMANHKDPGNAVLEQALRDVESKLGPRK